MLKNIEENTICVTINGSCDEKKSYSTIQQALDFVQLELEQGKAGKYDISLSPGTYFVKEPLIFDGSKITLPEKDYEINLCGSQEGVILTSNVNIPAKCFTENKACHVFEYTLPESAKDSDGNYPAFRDLYQNNRAMRLGSTKRPKDPTKLAIDSARRITESSLAMGVSSDKNLLYMKADYLDIIPIPRDEQGYFLDEEGNRIYVEFWVKDEWEMHMLRAESLRMSSSVHDDQGNYFAEIQILPEDFECYATDFHKLNCAGREFYFMNHASLVTEEGEFYYNPKIGKITLKGFACDNPEESIYSYPLLDCLIKIQNCHNWHMSGIELTGTTWNYPTVNRYYSGQANRNIEVSGQFPHHAAIFGFNVENIVIDHCFLHDVGLDGIYLTNIVRNVKIEDSRFENIGGTAIRFGEPGNEYDESRLCCKNIQIRNNYLYNIATRYFVCPSLFIPSSESTLITNNTIIRSNYTAISIGYAWRLLEEHYPEVVRTAKATITNNYIEDYNLELVDGGAIYTLGGNSHIDDVTYLNHTSGNVMVLRDCVGDMETGAYWTIYHDGSSSHWQDQNNLVIHAIDSMKPYHINLFNYQMIANQQSYRITTDSSYTIGMEKKDVEFLLKAFGRYKDVVPTQNENGSYDFGGPTFDQFHLEFHNAYVYENFDELSKDPVMWNRLKDLYNFAGCSFASKPREFGIMPNKSSYR